MSNNKLPYSGEEIELTIIIPKEWNNYLTSITSNPKEFVKYLLEQKLYSYGMVNIQPEFNDYNSEMYRH